MMDKAQFECVETELTRLLGIWAAGSVIKGSAIALIGKRTGHEQWRRFGRQNAMWGVVDALIAGAGTLSRGRRGPLDDEGAAEQAEKLKRLLLINAAADVVYVAGGLLIAARGRDGRTTWRMGRGDGLAILVQGAFLLVLDTTYARRLSS